MIDNLYGSRSSPRPGGLTVLNPSHCRITVMLRLRNPGNFDSAKVKTANPDTARIYLMPRVIIQCQVARPSIWFLVIGRLLQVRCLGISARTIIRIPVREFSRVMTVSLSRNIWDAKSASSHRHLIILPVLSQLKLGIGNPAWLHNGQRALDFKQRKLRQSSLEPCWT